MSCHTQKFLETETTNLILSILMANSGGLNEIEFYQECRLSFGIDFDERLANFNLTNIDEYINKYYVEDTFKNNASEDRFCKYLLSDMIDCFKTDRDTRKLYPCNKYFYKLKPACQWSSKYHKINFQPIFELTYNQKEFNYPRNYRDVIQGNRFKYDVKFDRILDCIPIQGNYDSKLPQPDFTPFQLRINIRRLLSDPKVLKRCPMKLERFCKIYKQVFKKSIKYHSQNPVYENYQILLSLGKDITFNKIYKFDEDYEKFVKYITIEPGNFINNNILLKNLHENLEILATVNHIDNQTFLTFDEMMILTFKRCSKILMLNEKCTSRTGEIKSKLYNSSQAFGKVGITSEQLYDFYLIIFNERVQFSLLGFKNYDELFKTLLSCICLFDGKKFLLRQNSKP